jgi:hypothetical protein
MGRSSPAAVLASLLALASCAGAAVIEVDHAGAGDYSTIQEGLDAAAAGDTVLVRPGIYTGIPNRELDFGGRGITLVSADGPDSTVIDCESLGRGFRFVTGEGPDAVVHGFTVVHGRGGSGGAALCDSTSPSFSRCVFRSCVGNPSGGAVSCTWSSSTFDSCRFVGNGSAFGGGLRGESSSLHLRGCTFSANFGQSTGGAIDLRSSDAVIEDSTFEGNESDDWGGAVHWYDSSGSIRGSTFTDNRCSLDGGALACRLSTMSVVDCEFTDNEVYDDGAAIAFRDANARVEGSVFTENVAQSVGGAIHCYSSPAEIVACRFVQNRAEYGGAIRSYLSDPRISDCTFEWNEASAGGGVYVLYGSQPIIERCTFFGNDAEYDGGGLHCQESSPLIRSCTFSGNTAGDDGSGMRFHNSGAVVTNTIVAFGFVSEGVACIGAGTHDFSHCCVFGNAGGDSLCGVHEENIYLNPGFCDPPYSNLTLRSDSPCLPSGNLWGEEIGAKGWGCEGEPYLPDACIVDEAVAPWETSAMIFLELPRAVEVRVRIYDLEGRLVGTPVGRTAYPGGVNTLSWDLKNDAGHRVASGTYFCVVEAGTEVFRRKIAVVGP